MNDDLPAFARAQPLQPASPRRWPTVMAIGLLGLVLGLQVLLADRARLAADPAWRPWLQRLCAPLGCALPAWREPQKLRVIAREVGPHPQAGAALQLRLSFRNDAAFAQAWPTLELAFADIDGELLAQRFYTPAEYLGGTPESATIAVGQAVDLQLDLVDPGKAALSFSIEFH